MHGSRISALSYHSNRVFFFWGGASALQPAVLYIRCECVFNQEFWTRTALQPSGGNVFF